jgi:uncharacterized protein YecT (DUF1311 family)
MKKKRYPKTKFVFVIKILVILIFPFVSRSQECEKVKITDFPAKDLPNESDRVLLRGEDPYVNYYGIGVEIDYVKARFLAFVVKENNVEEKPLDGYSILMMLYANGFGVERNLDLSIRLACANVWGAPAEKEGRIQHLNDMKTAESRGIFDICDDITSGFMDGICHSIRSELAVTKRKQEMDSIISKWTNQEKQAYLELRKAATIFFDERAAFEVDLTGTSRSAFQLDESDDLEDQFLSEIAKADKCSIKKYSVQNFVQADSKLNSVYSRIKQNKTTIYGSVTKDGVRKTQRKWIQYRNAWVLFAAVKCPFEMEISWKTMITNERIKQLQELVDAQK